MSAVSKGFILSQRFLLSWCLLFLILAASLTCGGCGRRGDSPEAPRGARTQSGDRATSPAAGTIQLEFHAQPPDVIPGRPSHWTLKLTDAATGQPVEDLAVAHEKLLHLLVVSSDLSWFAHLHPDYRRHGVFTTTVVIPRPGVYKLFADVTRSGSGHEVPRYEFATAGGVKSPPAIPLTPDRVQRDGWMHVTVAAHPEGEPDKQGGPKYEVQLMTTPSPLTAGSDAMLHFQIHNANGAPVTDLQPYLGAMGHAVILSADATQYLHAHPLDAPSSAVGSTNNEMHAVESQSGKEKTATGPEVVFHTHFPSAGPYKIWGQFQHHGRIITAPFVVDVKTP
jgi:hypothetical protein